MPEDKKPEKKSVPPKLKVPQMKKPGDAASAAKPRVISSPDTSKQDVTSSQTIHIETNLDGTPAKKPDETDTVLKAPEGPTPGVKHETPRPKTASPKAPRTVSSPRADAKSPVPGQGGSSSQTIHIQLPDLDSGATPAASKTPAPKQPETASPKKPMAPSVAAPKTIRLKAPGSVQVKKFATGIVEAEAKEEGVEVKDVAKKQSAGKGETSKVSMGEATPTSKAAGKQATGVTANRVTGPLSNAGTGVIGAKQTVRIQPMSADDTASAPKPGSDPIPPGHETPSDAQVAASKRKTSRISLEDALTGTSDEDETRPKTIRLKRPSEAATVKVKRTPKPSPAVDVQGAVAAAEPDKTAEISDEEATAAAKAPMTQRKTIRVKRPTRPGVQQGGKPSGEEEEDDDSSPVSAQVKGPGLFVPPAKMNPIFPVLAVATLLLAISLIWMFMAQAAGSNGSLTKLATFAQDFNVPWFQD